MKTRGFGEPCLVRLIENVDEMRTYEVAWMSGRMSTVRAHVSSFTPEFLKLAARGVTC